MTNRLAVSLWLSLVIVLGACGGSAPGPAGSGDSTVSSDPGVTVDPAFAVPAVGLDTLVERDERVVALAMDASGATSLLGPDVAGWLRDQRHDFVRELLERGGVTTASVKVASTDPRSGLGGPRTALASGGVALFLAGAFVGTFSRRATGEPGANDTMSLNDDITREGEFDGRRASVRMTTSIDFQVSGSRLEGSVTLTIAATLLDADGNATGTVTLAMTATVDVDACPDLDGAVHAHFDAETAVNATGDGMAGGAGSFRIATSGVASGEVGDDAFLHGFRITGEAGMTSSGGPSPTRDTAVTLDGRYGLSTPGQVSSLTFDGSSANGDVVRENENTTDADINLLYREVAGMGVVVAMLLFEAAQEKWRSGFCVRIEATETSRDVEPDEEVPFTAKPWHNFDGVELDEPIVATFTGTVSAAPVDVEQDPPASVTFTAGPDTGDRGTVSLKTTSRRGIGTLDIVFTVQEPFVLELSIESEITITKLGGGKSSGTTKAEGTIRLEKGPTGLWSGEGTITSTTRVKGGCGGVTIPRTIGTYDWVVREVKAEEGQAIDVWMDAGLISESPDAGVVHICPSLDVPTTLNTWENLFFVAHHKDYGAKGLHVTGWDALQPPWLPGQSFANAIWTDDCSGPSAAPGAGQVVGCTGMTTFYLSRVTP